MGLYAMWYYSHIAITPKWRNWQTRWSEILFVYQFYVSVYHFENLMILCPNCHAIMGNNSRANIGEYSTE